MKKILGIIVLGLLLSGNAYANCRNNLTVKWSIKEDRYVRFVFLNKSNRNINIYSYGIMTADNQIIKKNKVMETSNPDWIEGVYLQKFGKRRIDMYVSDINTNLIKYAYYECKYLK